MDFPVAPSPGPQDTPLLQILIRHSDKLRPPPSLPRTLVDPSYPRQGVVAVLLHGSIAAAEEEALEASARNR